MKSDTSHNLLGPLRLDPGPLRLSLVLLLTFITVGCGDDFDLESRTEQTVITPGTEESAAKPNILLIVADDLGYNDLAINNVNTLIDTPNMDQLAKNGVRFTRHYAAAVCSPARAALLTGQYPERNGYQGNSRGLSAELITLPEKLQEEGYTTWHIGKWHIGDVLREAWPDRQGFDHWFGFLNQSRLAGKQKDGKIQLTRPRYENPWLESDSGPGRFYEGHLEDILTSKTIDVVSDLKDAQSPWFINLWYYAPHEPVTPSAEFAAHYPDTKAGRYRALVNQLDSNVGRIIGYLESIDALRNTIVVLVSDNGGTNAHIDNNAPYLGKKSTLGEGGLRTPLIIHWPDNSLNKQVLTDPISIQDLYPTLADAVGVSVPKNLDGKSFYRHIQGIEPAPKRPLFWEHIYSFSALSEDGLWRIIKPAPYFKTVPELRLYDYEVDGRNTRELAPTPQAPTAQLLQSYQSWHRDVHTVKTRFSGTKTGDGILTGMEFMRTPGLGDYTFGIGISGDRQGPLATQRGIWDISRTDNTITAQFGDLTLSGDIEVSKDCHSIIISGLFTRRVLHIVGPDNIKLSLYIDGRKAQTVAAKSTLAVNDPAVETVIGDPENQSATGTIFPPVILNIRINSNSLWTPESLSQELCESNSPVNNRPL